MASASGHVLSTWLALFFLIGASHDGSRCRSSHLPWFFSRALFLSRKRCLAAVRDSCVFRFDILTTSVTVPEPTKMRWNYIMNKLQYGLTCQSPQKRETHLFRFRFGLVSSRHACWPLLFPLPSQTRNNCLLHVTWAGVLPPTHTLSKDERDFVSGWSSGVL